MSIAIAWNEEKRVMPSSKNVFFMTGEFFVSLEEGGARQILLLPCGSGWAFSLILGS